MIMKGQIDLHVHSCLSDGTCTPKQLIALAGEKNITAMALTDHDTVKGISAAMTAASGSSVELVPGIEMSCLYTSPNKDDPSQRHLHDGNIKKEIHMVGLFIDHKNKVLTNAIHTYQKNREKRNQEMAEKLTVAGFPVTISELEQMFPHAVLTRAHFANFLVKKGFLKDKNTAFKKYIGEGCPCYVEKFYVSPKQAIDTIHAAGGVAILAHPLLYQMTDQLLETMVYQLKELGLDGIETMYSTYSDSQQLYMRDVAAKFHLLESGGSDFHGANKPDISLGTGRGHLRVPVSYLNAIKEYMKI